VDASAAADSSMIVDVGSSVYVCIVQRTDVQMSNYGTVRYGTIVATSLDR